MGKKNMTQDVLQTNFPVQFFRIPKGIRSYRLNPYQFAVYCYLAELANYGSTVFPSATTIAEKTSMSRRKAIYVLSELEEKGLLTKEKRRNKEGSYTSNLYTVIYCHEEKVHNMHTPSAQNAPPPSAQNALELDKNLLIRKYTSIFEEWNKQKIIQHKKITKKMEREVDKLLKGKRDDLEEKQTEEEVIEAIRNYGHVVNSPGFYFKYKWRLDEFLRRGYLKFKDGQLAKQNYAIDKNNFEPEDNKPSLKDRTDAYTKKLLEEERANGVESEKNARSRDGNNRSDTC